MEQNLRGKAFDEYKPDLSDEDITVAHDSARIVVSLRGRPCLVSDNAAYLAVKLALYDGSFLTVLFDRISADALASIIQSAKSVDCEGEAMKSRPS
jgi:hypothetical protein